MTVAMFMGFETGDASEWPVISSPFIVSEAWAVHGKYGGTTTIGSGSTSTTGIFSTGVSSGSFAPTKWATRWWMRLPTEAVNFFVEAAAAGNGLLLQWVGSISRLQVIDLSAGMGWTDPTVVITNKPGEIVCLELICDKSAGGVIQLRVNGMAVINGTHTVDTSSNTTFRWFFQDINYYLDDFRADINTTTPIGPGRVLARQGRAGTPTYDAWTKSGAATADACWSNTPFSTATNCVATSTFSPNPAQTMLISQFSQAYRGTMPSEIVGPGDVINAVKIGCAEIQAGGGTMAFRRVVDGVTTDTSNIPTGGGVNTYIETLGWISAAGGGSGGTYTGVPFTVTNSQLDTMEAGAVFTGGASVTIHDLWVMADSNPGFYVDSSPTSIKRLVSMTGY